MTSPNNTTRFVADTLCSECKLLQVWAFRLRRCQCGKKMSDNGFALPDPVSDAIGKVLDSGLMLVTMAQEAAKVYDRYVRKHVLGFVGTDQISGMDYECHINWFVLPDRPATQTEYQDVRSVNWSRVPRGVRVLASQLVHSLTFVNSRTQRRGREHPRAFARFEFKAPVNPDLPSCSTLVVRAEITWNQPTSPGAEDDIFDLRSEDAKSK